MKYGIAILICILSVLAAIGQKPGFKWADHFKVLQPGSNRTSVVDKDGNTYLTGTFTGVVDFDPGPEVFNLDAPGDHGLSSAGDMFIVKLNAGGELVWAKRVTGKFCVTAGLSIAVDASGNVYTTGTFYGTDPNQDVAADFDPGPGIANLALTSKSYDAFILKLDACGNFAWVKQLSGSKDDRAVGKSITVDAQQNIYIVGDFAGANVDFDPGPGVYKLPSNFDVTRIVVCKYDAAGNFNWAKQMVPKQVGNVIFGAKGNSIAVDKSGNVLITGIFVGEIDFDPGPGVAMLSANTTYGNGYVVKLNAYGDLVWAKQIGKASSSRVYGSSIIVNDDGDVYTAGSFNGLADFDPGPGEYNLVNSSIVNQSIFVFKLNNAGDFVWAKQMGDTSLEMDVAIALDATGNIYTAGNFSGKIDADPGPATHYLQATGGRDVFVSKMDPGGNFIWAESWGGSATSDIYGLSVGVDKGNNVITSGTFLRTVDFDPGIPVNNISTANVSEIFVNKLSPCTGNSVSVMNITECTSYTLNCKMYTATGVYKQTVTNTIGCDSIITLNLTILSPTDTIKVETCNSYNWHGRNYTASGYYSDTLKSVNGCDSIITLDLNVLPASFTEIHKNICSGNEFAGYNTNGKFIDTLIAANGCDSIRTIYLTILPLPAPDLGADKALCDGDTLTLYPGQFDSYQWQDGWTGNKLIVNKRGLYSVLVTDSCGTGTDEVLIKEGICDIYFPSAFSPNSDGKNDQFNLLTAIAITDYSLVVYNRWGQQVFESKDRNKGWDGRLNGKAMENGMYVWFCQFNRSATGEHIVKRGSVMLIR